MLSSSALAVDDVLWTGTGSFKVSPVSKYISRPGGSSDGHGLLFDRRISLKSPSITENLKDPTGLVDAPIGDHRQIIAD
uniref:Pectate lyase n=1 Tax=Steinernema glaseri TaxID=37863 RepID=A0A1I7ZM78_9BILA